MRLKLTWIMLYPNPKRGKTFTNNERLPQQSVIAQEEEGNARAPPAPPQHEVTTLTAMSHHHGREPWTK